MEWWHDYSDKPGGILTIGHDYKLIDVNVADPPFAGSEEHLLYLNLSPVWAAGSQDGWVQVKYIREGGDDTAYQTYAFLRIMPGLLITFTHFEVGERGRGGRWWAKCGGGLLSVKAGTRYCKIDVKRI